MIGAASVLASCSGMLDQYPNSAINPDNITAKDIPSMRIGMYTSMQNSPTAYGYMIFDILGGDLTQTNYNPIDVINTTLSPLSSVISGQWNGYYDALYQVNNMIEAVNRFPEAENAAMTLGEAHYFRALIYLNLVTRWGAVPVLEVNTMEKVRRDPVERVWQFIDGELDKASTYLSSSKNYYYVSLDAVRALQARVALYQGDNTKAAEIAEDLITSGRYTLDSFSKIFDISRPTNSETIFAFMNLNIAESSINIGDYYYTYGHPNKGMGRYRLTDAAVQLFADSDNRKANSVVLVDGTNCINKYPSGQSGRDPFIVSRLAEMYLISAEAQGYPKGLDRLNDLRKARGLGAASASSQDTFIDAVLLERRMELMGENHLYYDYVRLGKAVSELGIKEYQTLFPIPGKELQLNDLLEPNPGY